jgi:hypothetical protein
MKKLRNVGFRSFNFFFGKPFPSSAFFFRFFGTRHHRIDYGSERLCCTFSDSRTVRGTYQSENLLHMPIDFCSFLYEGGRFTENAPESHNTWCFFKKTIEKWLILTLSEPGCLYNSSAF